MSQKNLNPKGTGGGGGEGAFQKFNVQYVKIFIQDVTQKS